ncbi:MAG: hypothetical protein GY832_20215 [Chloroflexi bacterium]|nr:hypothetical protein [Chloroflexota bacterium]
MFSNIRNLVVVVLSGGAAVAGALVMLLYAVAQNPEFISGLQVAADLVK